MIQITSTKASVMVFLETSKVEFVYRRDCLPSLIHRLLEGKNKGNCLKRLNKKGIIYVHEIGIGKKLVQQSRKSK